MSQPLVQPWGEGIGPHLQHLLPVEADEVLVWLRIPCRSPGGLLLRQQPCQVNVSVLQHHVYDAFRCHHLRPLQESASDADLD